MSNIKLLIGAVLLIAVLISWNMRLGVQPVGPNKYAAVITDRWTGEVSICSAGVCSRLYPNPPAQH